MSLKFAAAGVPRGEPAHTLSFLSDLYEGDRPTRAVVDSFVAVRRVLDEREQQRLGRDRGFQAGGDHYVGVEVCGRCHESIAGEWDTGRHAKAWRTLVGQRQGQNPNCLPCHTTGFLEQSGAEITADVDDGPDAQRGRRLYGVQCEACHGRGTRHGQPDFTARIEAAVCTRCHDAENDPNFDFRRALAQGVHRH